MSYPTYVTNEIIHSDGTSAYVAVLTATPKRVVLYDSLDAASQADLDTLVTANGGILPLPNIEFTKTVKLSNGVSWWDTYQGIVRIVTFAILTRKGVDMDEVYYDGTEWRHVYDNSIVSAATGDGSSTVSIDQTTIGTSNAVYPLETSDVLDLTLSLSTTPYTSGTVLADTQVLTGVMRLNGGTALLQSLKITDASDQGQALDIVFLKSNVSLGTENAAVSISDTDAKEILGIIPVATSDYVDLGGVQIATVPLSATIMFKSAVDSTSIYVAAISRGTGTYAVDGISMKIGIVRL